VEDYKVHNVSKVMGHEIKLVVHKADTSDCNVLVDGTPILQCGKNYTIANTVFDAAQSIIQAVKS
jgi:hypothetical protein